MARVDRVIDDVNVRVHRSKWGGYIALVDTTYDGQTKGYSLYGPYATGAEALWHGARQAGLRLHGELSVVQNLRKD